MPLELLAFEVPALDRWLRWLQETRLATVIAENDNLFPFIESIHVLAISLVIGTIAIVDLRLLGLASRDRAAARLIGEVLPYTWAAFGAAAVAGGLLFASNATTYAYNFYFQGKMLLMGLAGINMTVFHLFTGREVARWGTAERTSLGAKAAGAVSLALWIGVVVFGRKVGFTLH
jgi:Family of unknown function (DUF6644)